MMSHRVGSLLLQDCTTCGASNVLCAVCRNHDQWELPAVSAEEPVMKQERKAQDTQVAGSHYTSMKVQPWDVVDSWPLEQRIGYYRGNVIKYMLRMGNKDARLQEAEKAKHYAEKLIEVLKEGNDIH